MRGLVPGIHVFLLFTEAKKTWMAETQGRLPVFGGLRPAMTNDSSGYSGKT